MTLATNTRTDGLFPVQTADDAAVEALHAILRGAADAAFMLDIARFHHPAQAETLAQTSAALDAARVATLDAMAILRPDGDACAICGSRYSVRYVQRGDLYLCVSHDGTMA